MVESVMTEKMQGLHKEGFATGRCDWTNEELLNALHCVCDVARSTPESGQLVMADDEATRNTMRKIILGELSGEWARVHTPEDGSASWWQVELKNKAIIRVAKIDKRYC